MMLVENLIPFTLQNKKASDNALGSTLQYA